MGTAIGFIALFAIIAVILWARWLLRHPSTTPKPLAPTAKPPATKPPAAVTPTAVTPRRFVEDDRESDAIGGWLLGHHLRAGHNDFPGDPLPDGHLGHPSDLAYWSLMGDERDDYD